jgi:hypothetical protein
MTGGLRRWSGEPLENKLLIVPGDTPSTELLQTGENT